MYVHTTASAAASLFKTYARSLIAYAETDHWFATQLAHQYRTANPGSLVSVPDPVSTYITPRSRADALRLQSLLKTAPLHTTSDILTSSEQCLARWARQYEEPQNIIFGIVGVDIIGPTLGLVQSKKKKKNAMRLIIDAAHYRTLNKKDLIVLTSEAAGMQFSSELRAVTGNAFLLHPDTADWCFTDHLTELYTESKRDLTLTNEILRAEELPHSVMYKDKKMVAIALSPQIDEVFTVDRNCQRV